MHMSRLWRSRVGLRILTPTLGLAAAWAITALAQQHRPLCDEGNGGITLPAGFCAAVVADNIGFARHIALSPRGDMYVMQRNVREGLPPGSIIALRDADGDGRFEQQERFGGADLVGTAIAWRDNYLYVGANTKIVRYRMGDALVPTGQPEVIVDGFDPDRQHAAKPFAFGDKGELFVHVGPPSNACQQPDRKPGVPGVKPCPILEEHAGIWKYDANTPNQKHARNKRYSTGMRHTVSLVWNPATRGLYGVQHGRDALDTMWPNLFDAKQNAELPAEEMQVYTEGADYGWPYCYYDPFQKKRVLSPEYGGDGKQEGDCAKYNKPVVAFPAHYGPNALLFYAGTQFPQEYRNGAFVAFHGSWNRAPLPQAGYNVMFVPFKDGKPAGEPTVFADKFGGTEPVMDPRKATYRPAGLALARDGSVYVSEDAKGRIWKISYVGQQ
jgi:glucose/arabinose dehydrogenase